MKAAKNASSRISSICYAQRGLIQLIKQEPNAKIHAAATIVAIVAGVIKNLHRHQWMAIILAIALVRVAEALNTAIEMLCDIWCKNEYHPTIKIIKDIAAGAVLVAALASIAIAFIVFYPL